MTVDRKIVVVSSDVVGDSMAGPAIRATELAKVLEDNFGNVLLAAPNNERVDGLEVVSWQKHRLGDLVSGAQVVVGQGIGVPMRPLLQPGHALVLDWYDPNPVEVMAHHRDSSPRVARRSQEFLRRQLLPLAKRADHIMCATARQRDFWIGLLAAAGRLSWEADQSHPNLEDLMSIVPFGLSGAAPQADEPVLKGVWPGIGVDDKVLLWGGGIWNWFDPLTVIRAVGRLAAIRNDIRLFFMGVSHPNPAIKEMAMVQRAIDLARELNLLDRVVFFNHGWVDYHKRAGYLLESDLAVLAAGDDIETRLSFRTRLLDGLWAGLPMVVSDGDFFADMIKEQNLGRVVPVGDDQAMTLALTELLENPDELARCRTNIERTATDFTWPNVAKPLVEFCANPRHHPGAAHSATGCLGLVLQQRLGTLAVAAQYGGVVKVVKRKLLRHG